MSHFLPRPIRNVAARRAGLRPVMRALVALLCLSLSFPCAAWAEADDYYISTVPAVTLLPEELTDDGFEPAPAQWLDDYDTLGDGALPDVPDAHADSEAAGGDFTPDPYDEYSLDDALADSLPVFPRTFTITVGGDTTLGSTDSLRKRDDCFENVVAQNGYEWPFSGLLDLFSRDDMTLINFEGTLTESTRKKEKKFNFKAPADYAQILTLGSVEAVNIANNHIVDYNDDGKNDTIAALDAEGIVLSGGGILGVYESRGVKVGMTGYCFPYSNGKKDISKDIAALREAGCQIVIASFHWGSEYSYDFTAEQRSIGRAAIKAGADVVVGHHPHVVQGIEKYDDTYILYSLGNLVFGGNVDPDDRDAYVARLTFTVTETDCSAPEIEIVPIHLTELSKGTDYRPVPAQGEEAERIVKKILRKSYKMEEY